MLKKIFFIYFVAMIIPCHSLLSEDRDSVLYKTSTFEDFWKRVKYSDKVENNYLFNISYGYYVINYPHKDIISPLSNVFKFEITYGFHRLEEHSKDNKLNYLASESVSLSNISSHMTFDNWKDGGKTSDAWKFNFNYKNGFGSGDLIFTHSGSLSWIKIDFENYGESKAEQKRYDVFDEEFRFGQEFGTGIKYFAFDNLSFDLEYENLQYNPKHLFWRWSGSALIELLLQRTVDYFGPEYYNVLQEDFPIVNWSVKSLISIIIYELRNNKNYFPFSDEPSFNYKGATISLSYIF